MKRRLKWRPMLHNEIPNKDSEGNYSKRVEDAIMSGNIRYNTKLKRWEKKEGGCY